MKMYIAKMYYVTHSKYHLQTVNRYDFVVLCNFVCQAFFDSFPFTAVNKLQRQAITQQRPFGCVNIF